MELCLKRQDGMLFPVIRELDAFQYEAMLIRVYEEGYVPTEEELMDDYEYNGERFFIVHRNNNNFVVFIED